MSILNVTAISSEPGINVYWDPSATISCTYINWGELSPGSRKNIVVYVKNEANSSLFYLLTTKQWNPLDTSNYMTLQWDCDDSSASTDTIRRVCLTLTVSPRIRGVIEFSFDIVIKGSTYMWGDVNCDKKIDILDVGTVAFAYNRWAQGLDWNEKADIDQDGNISITDIAMTSKHYGKTYA